MKSLTFVTTLVLLLCLACPLSAKKALPPGEGMQGEVSGGLGEILDLWRDGRYEDLYRRTIPSGKQSKETFIGRLASSDRRPACCWEKMQEVSVAAKDEARATIHVKVGMEGKDGFTGYVTKRLKMEKEDGLWKISASDLLSLAGSGKKRSHRQYLKKKGNTAVYY